jgi:hypothetical protein
VLTREEFEAGERSRISQEDGKIGKNLTKKSPLPALPAFLLHPNLGVVGGLAVHFSQ